MTDLVDVLGPSFERGRFSFLPKGAAVFLWWEQETDDPSGYFASGDEEADLKLIESIRERVRSGDVWAWCTVFVSVKFGDFEETTSLGACSYESQKDFERCDYFHDMVVECFETMRRKWERCFLAMVECGVDLPALVDQAVKHAHRVGGGSTAAGKLLGISRDQVRYRLTKTQREGGVRTGQKSLP